MSYEINKESLEKALRKIDCDTGYEPPIKLYENFVNNVNADMENNLMEIVHQYYFDVDKDELFKLLNNERQEYRKGYRNGYSNGYACGYEDGKMEQKEINEKFAKSVVKCLVEMKKFLEEENCTEYLDFLKAITGDTDEINNSR